MTIKSVYSAGKRAGMAPPVSAPMVDGTRVLITPKCPFSLWRFVSFFVWHEGYYDGTMARLSKF